MTRVHQVGFPVGARILFAGLACVFIALASASGSWAAQIVGGENGVPSSYTITVTIFGVTETLEFSTTNASWVLRGNQVGDTISLEVLRADAVGNHPTLGQMLLRAGRQNGIEPTVGQVENIVQDPEDPGFPSGNQSSLIGGDQTLNVFFEVELVDLGITITNAPLPAFGIPGTPLVAVGAITALPPTAGTTYAGTQSVPMYDVATGEKVNFEDDETACVNVVAAGPATSVPTLQGWGMILLILVLAAGLVIWTLRQQGRLLTS